MVYSLRAHCSFTEGSVMAHCWYRSGVEWEWGAASCETHGAIREPRLVSAFALGDPCFERGSLDQTENARMSDQNVPGFNRTVTAPGATAVSAASPLAPAAPGATDAARPADAPVPGAGAAPAGGGAAPDPAAAKPDAAAGADKAEQKVSQHLAKLARERQSLETKRRAWQADWQKQQAELQSQRDDLAKAREEITAFRKERDELRTDPNKWLEKGGFKYEDVTQQLLADGNADPRTLLAAERERTQGELQRLRDENAKAVKEEREQRERFVKEEQDRRNANDRQLIVKFHNDTVAHVQAHAEEYPITVALQRHAEVPALIDQFYKQTFNADIPRARAEGRQPFGRIMTAAEAAEKVEAFYRDQFAAADKAQKDIAARKAAAAAAPSATGAPVNQQSLSAAGAPVPPKDQHATLSNSVLSTPPKQVRGPLLSEAERMERARAAMDAATAAARARQ